MNMQQQVSNAFEEIFGERPDVVVRAPGRVNIIGEHTDYNDGFVLPMAMDRAVWVALRPRDRRPRAGPFAATGSSRPTSRWMTLLMSAAGWSEYVKGMAAMLQQAGHQLTGWEGILSSDVPVGSGLSSSAALEMATGSSFCGRVRLPVRWCGDGPTGPENGERVGRGQYGIMDQMISANGRRGTRCSLTAAISPPRRRRYRREPPSSSWIR